ncbi:hypothetical protein PVAND_015575 [Polypedilum vanderplanki]|uniref:Fatty acyl-CoA reductase n=1 Tax=Polypedilum vanderplanki TaxID=319348 RepID=A0A9J6BD98_POLVA|nr:hypothetical protein PVAND_015575 [Polypedilum vanderplanki]
MSRQISILEFYSGKCVFITGGTGFIGKMIVEKLLRSCPEVDTIYLLARAKKNKTASERVQEITDSPLFDVIRAKNAEALKKISLIEGDISKENLGMSESDQKLFCEKINIIIHSAATLNLQEPIKVAVATNLQSVKELMNLARKVKKLDSFVHVSTAYTNWFEKDVKEIFYKPNYDPNKVIEMCKTLSNEEVEKMIPTLGKHKNTYTFSKSLAEYLMSQEGIDLPLTIVRPSMVISSLNEPFPGWIDNWAGPSPFVFMTAKGLFRHPHMRRDVKLDVIPADLTVNMVLAAGWKVGTDPNARNSVPEIYNCTTSSNNPILCKDLFQGFVDIGKKYPYSDTIWYPKMKFYHSALASQFFSFAYQKIPAYFVDFVMKLSGKKPKLIKTLNFSYNNYNNIKWVPTNNLVFYSENPQKILNAMNPKDLQVFDFDVRKINWQKYIEIYHFGLRKHLANEKSENWPALRKKVQRLKYIHYIVTGSMIAGSLFLLYKSQNSFQKKKENNEIKS